tara:strand:- start:471 stop:734 length:264 start_codon:yes stop_codon:yes gene_type:complete
MDIINRLKKSGLEPDIFDPWIKDDSFEKAQDIIISSKMPNKKYDAIILAVGHEVFNKIDLLKYKKDKESIVYDVKGFLDKDQTTKRL